MEPQQSHRARRIRVAFAIDNLSRAGTESQLLALIRSLDRTRFEPTLILLDGDSEPSRELEPPDCHIIRLGVRKLFSRTAIRQAKHLRDLWKAEPPDILQAYFLDASYFTIPIAKWCGVRTVIRVRNNLGYWLTRKHRVLSRAIRRYVDFSLTNSEAGRASLIQHDGLSDDRVVVIENGVDCERFHTDISSILESYSRPASPMRGGGAGDRSQVFDATTPHPNPSPEGGMEQSPAPQGFSPFPLWGAGHPLTPSPLRGEGSGGGDGERDQLSRSGDECNLIRIGCVANLRPVKNIDGLIRAAKILLVRFPNLSFQVAGDGEQRAELAGLIRELNLGDRFQLLGSVADIPAFLQSLDIAVLPSHSEGMSNALLEYMAAGRAIVATDVGANAKLIRDGVHGRIVPSNDVSKLAEAIGELVEHPEAARRMAAAAREHVVREYSRDAMRKRFESFYERCVSGSQPATLAARIAPPPRLTARVSESSGIAERPGSE